MKDFFKFTLATITGIILTSIVMFVISIIVVFSMLSSTETETVVKKNSIMMLDLNGSLVERTSDNIFKELFDKEDSTYGLDDILASIKKAKENDDIKGIYIQATSLNANFASLQEIRDALNDFKKKR